MVNRTYILALIVTLTLFACGSRKKQIRQEHQHTEQTVSQRTEESHATRGEKNKESVELVDKEGVTATTLYGAEGTIGPDGSFTGKADSAKTVSTNKEQKRKAATESESHASAAASTSDAYGSVVSEETKTAKDVEVKRSVPWWLWVCMALLLAFSFWFGIWKRGLSNWILKLFKRVIK